MLRFFDKFECDQNLKPDYESRISFAQNCSSFYQNKLLLVCFDLNWKLLPCRKKMPKNNSYNFVVSRKKQDPDPVLDICKRPTWSSNIEWTLTEIKTKLPGENTQNHRDRDHVAKRQKVPSSAAWHIFSKPLCGWRASLAHICKGHSVKVIVEFQKDFYIF